MSPLIRTDTQTDTIDLTEVAHTVRRNAKAVLLCVALGIIAAVTVLLFAPRRFEGRSTILARVEGMGAASIGTRIEGIGQLLGGIGGLAGNSGIETEMQILRSRDLAGRVVDSLRLQMRVREPRLPPTLLFEQVQFAGSFEPRKIQFERIGTDKFRAMAGDSSWELTPGVPGAVAGGSISLARENLPVSFSVAVLDREAAVDRFARRLKVTKAGGEVAKVTYQGDDSLSAAAAANLLTAYYLDTHKSVDRGVNERRVEFVRAQLDSTSRELAAAERGLREYQERSGVIDYELVGAAEVEGAKVQRQKLTELQVEEATMRELLSLAEQGQLTSRDLAAYPGFLRSTTAATLANQLTTLEAERIALLQRRTERDPDVVAVDKTMRAVENNIVALARSYTASVSRQRLETEARLDSLQQSILAIPATAERGGRLKRDVLRLSQIFTALQAQLMEAQFGAVSEGGLLRQIDVAVPQRVPSFPKPILTLGIGTAAGLLCGLVAALFLGWFGRWLRDPQEVERAVGVIAQRYEANMPLLMGGPAGGRTVLLVPLGARAPLASVAERLERTARQRALQPVVMDLTGAQPDVTSGGVIAVIDRLEREHDAVIVQMPPLGTETTVAALSETRPVLFVAPPGPVDRAHLNNAVNTLRLLKVPCAGVVMHDGSDRVLA